MLRGAIDKNAPVPTRTPGTAEMPRLTVNARNDIEPRALQHNQQSWHCTRHALSPTLLLDPSSPRPRAALLSTHAVPFPLSPPLPPSTTRTAATRARDRERQSHCRARAPIPPPPQCPQLDDADVPFPFNKKPFTHSLTVFATLETTYTNTHIASSGVMA